MDLTFLSDPQIWIGLLTLTALEIVLGIDNIVFITILAGKLPKEQQEGARKKGLILALIPRIVLLLFIPFVQSMDKPLFTIPVLNMGITGQDLVLFVGGLFLLYKAVHEIHSKLEGDEAHVTGADKAATTVGAVIGQIMLLNVVFSIDSVVTALGMTNNVPVMVVSVILSTLFMLAFAGKVGAFVEAHPTVKMLALAFLILIGFNLIVEALHYHIPKGYTYFAMAFSVGVEMLNLRLRGKGAKPVHLHTPSR